MRKIKSILFVLAAVMILCSICSAETAMNEYYISDLNMNISIPDGWLVFTKDMLSDKDSGYDSGTIAAISQLFEERSIYLDAFNQDNEHEIILIANEMDPAYSTLFANMNEFLMNLIISQSSNSFQNNDLTVLEKSIYETPQRNYARLVATDANAGTVIRYFFFKDNKMYIINLNTNGSLEPGEEDLLQKVIDSLYFSENNDASAEDTIITPNLSEETAADNASASVKDLQASPLSDFEVSKTGVLEKYIGNEANVVIPDSIIAINSWAFDSNTSVESVVIPDGVLFIGQYAFSGCENLVSVTIPGSVFSIGRSAFYNSKQLKNVTIGDGVLYVENDAFSNCESIEEITIPDSVIGISGSAFWGCKSLKTVNFGSGLKFIQDYAFQSCDQLTNVSIPENVIYLGKGNFSYRTTVEVVKDSPADQWCRAYGLTCKYR